MSEVFANIKKLILYGDIKVSDHGYNELANDDIFIRDLIDSASRAVVLENYADYPKGPCVLVLQYDADHQPVHVVWGMPKGELAPAVLVTAYRPDPTKWTDDFRRRKK